MNFEKPSTLEQQDPVSNYPSSTPPPATPTQHRWWLWLLILVVVGLAVYHFRPQPSQTNAAVGTSGAASKGGKGGGFGTIPVVAVAAHKGDIGVFFTGLGAVTPIYTVTIKSQISGYLMKVYYKEGDTVRQGDLLAEIDPRPYQVMLEQAQAGLARDQANLDNARIDLVRYQTLAPLKAIPEQQLATQEATVKQDEATIKTDQAQIHAAQLDLTYCHITAPITGRVGLRLVDPGNYVTPNDATGLVVITQVEPISVVFTLPEDQLPAVLARMRVGAKLRVDAYDREMKTKISQGWLATIDNQIDPTTGTVKLRANFDNRDGSLFPNQFVNARLLVEEKQGVTLIPTAAVQRNSQITYVYLVRPDSSATVRNITVGTSEGEDSEVTYGLNPGDQVVMTGVDKLQEGSKVRVQKPGERSSKGSS
jgi:multidrug efflux system membrane fusion protein